jgi:hypothetical protein
MDLDVIRNHSFLRFPALLWTEPPFPHMLVRATCYRAS